jgi:polar amino acid transport system substrate-binding protein
VLGKDGIAELERIYQLPGRCVRLVSIPNKRGAKAFRAGQTDGELGRTATYQSLLGRTALRVPTPISTPNLIIYTTDPAITDVTALRGREIGYIHGFVEHEKVLAQVGGQGMPAETFDGLWRMLAAGRTPAIMASELAFQTAEKLPKGHAFPISVTPLYLYIHRRHAGLVAAFDVLIRQRAASGLSLLPGFVKPGTVKPAQPER